MYTKTEYALKHIKNKSIHPEIYLIKEHAEKLAEKLNKNEKTWELCARKVAYGDWRKV